MWARLILTFLLCVFLKTGASAASIEGITEYGGMMRISVFIEPNESVEGVCHFVVSKYPEISKEECLRETIQKGRHLVLPSNVSPQTFPNFTDGSGFFATPIVAKKKTQPVVAASTKAPEALAFDMPLTLQVALSEPVEEEMRISVPEPPQEVTISKMETPAVPEVLPMYDEALEETQTLNSKVLLQVFFWAVGAGVLLILAGYLIQSVVPWVRKKIRERAIGGGMVPPPQPERKEPMFGNKKEKGGVLPAGPVQQHAITSKPSEAGAHALIDSAMKGPGSLRPSMNPNMPANKGLPYRVQDDERALVHTSQEPNLRKLEGLINDMRSVQQALDLVVELDTSSGLGVVLCFEQSAVDRQSAVIAKTDGETKAVGRALLPVMQDRMKQLLHQVEEVTANIRRAAMEASLPKLTSATTVAEITPSKTGDGKVVTLNAVADSPQSSGNGSLQAH